jgi:hypothetical protein
VPILQHDKFAPWILIPTTTTLKTLGTPHALQSLCFNEAFWLKTKLAYSINSHSYTWKYAKSSSKDERWEKHLPS